MIHREKGNWNESAKDLEKSIEIFKEIGMDKDLGKSHYEFGIMWKAKGEPEKAREHLDKALTIFEKLNLAKEPGMVRDALKEIKEN